MLSHWQLFKEKYMSIKQIPVFTSIWEEGFAQNVKQNTGA